jgi:hypothetical protein
VLSTPEAMAKPKRDPIREDRIQNEAVVDAYGPEEQAMSWYYYLENKMRFPFRARCIASKVVSPLRKGQAVAVNGKLVPFRQPGVILLHFIEPPRLTPQSPDGNPSRDQKSP